MVFQEFDEIKEMPLWKVKENHKICLAEVVFFCMGSMFHRIEHV